MSHDGKLWCGRKLHYCRCCGLWAQLLLMLYFSFTLMLFVNEAKALCTWISCLQLALCLTFPVLQYFVICHFSWHKSVALCPVDWIIHRGTAGHTSYCYLTLAETLSQQWERTCVRVDWNGRDAELHTEGKRVYRDEWLVEEKQMSENMKEKTEKTFWWKIKNWT